jgi:thiosulfate/3-mercaptopyruvate sulfurtransferase
MPYGYLTRDGGGLFVDRQTAAALWSQAGVPTEGEQITFCNLGYLASLSWYVAYEILGNKQAKLYDGSLADWSADESLPMENVAVLADD